MALYAVGFGGYAAEVLPWHMPDWGAGVGIGLVLVIIGVNFIGSRPGATPIGRGSSSLLEPPLRDVRRVWRRHELRRRYE